MNKTKLKNDIFNAIMSKGVISSKDDIISNDPEERVYTKRLNIGKDYTSKDFKTIEVVCVTVTSDNKELKGATIRNVRFNMKNPQGQWVNLFMHEVPNELLEFVYKNVVK